MLLANATESMPLRHIMKRRFRYEIFGRKKSCELNFLTDSDAASHRQNKSCILNSTIRCENPFAFVGRN